MFISPTRFTHSTILVLTLLGCLLSACAASRPQIVVHESPRGSVSIEKADRRLQAAHPIVIDPGIIQKVLQGIVVEEEGSALETLLSSSPKLSRVFSDRDVEFLAPLLSTALSQASHDQIVRFRVHYHSGVVPPGAGAGVGSSEPVSTPKIATTSGTLYAYGLSLNVMLAEYHHRSESPDAINMPNRRLPDPTGLGSRKVLFLPEAARRPDNFSPTAGDADLTTLVVDYELLSKLPPSTLERERSNLQETGRKEPRPAGESASQEGSSKDLQTIKDQLIKRDKELDAVKEELKAIKKQLGEEGSQKEGTPPAP
jgi:hypothetical protein